MTDVSAPPEPSDAGPVEHRGRNTGWRTFADRFLALDFEGNPVPPRVLTFWLEFDLVRQRGGWLVDGVRNLNFGASRAPGNEPVPGAGGTDAPTSTAP